MLLWSVEGLGLLLVLFPMAPHTSCGLLVNSKKIPGKPVC